MEYFKEGLAQWEVNEENQKGYQGKLVARFDKLINDLTSGTISSFAPTELRTVIAKKNLELCQAGQQQDSAEILSVILDGLHEDLNRADGTEKYEEFPDSNGRSDDVVSEEHWKIHRKLNDSLIVDLFQFRVEHRHFGRKSHNLLTLLKKVLF